jgi:alpha-galactosidase
LAGWEATKNTVENPGMPVDTALIRQKLLGAGGTEWEVRWLTGMATNFDEIAQSHEYGAFIIHSLETGVPRVVYGNVANHGLIDNLPAGCTVEVPCLVDKNGLQPVKIGNLPPQLAALIQTNVNVQSLAVEAAVTGKREYIYHAAMLDPHTSARPVSNNSARVGSIGRRAQTATPAFAATSSAWLGPKI